MPFEGRPKTRTESIIDEIRERYKELLDGIQTVEDINDMFPDEALNEGLYLTFTTDGTDWFVNMGDAEVASKLDRMYLEAVDEFEPINESIHRQLDRYFECMMVLRNTLKANQNKQERED